MKADAMGLPRSPVATAFIAASACPVLVALCILLVDRPASTWAHAEFSGRDGLFRGLTHIVDPLLPTSCLGLAAAAVAALCGWRPGRAGHLLIACGLAVLVSCVFKDQLKFGFGRLWPETWVDDNPSWIKDGAYGFYPFHGRTGWSSFPSGHMTTITAPIAVLWAALPRWRAALACPVLLVAIGLYGADFHFVGDMVAGSFLGAACGTGVVATLRDPRAGLAAAAPMSHGSDGQMADRQGAHGSETRPMDRPRAGAATREP